MTQVAKWLDLLLPSKERKRTQDFDVDLAEDIGSLSAEIVVNEHALGQGNKLMDIALPDDALVVMVKRGESYFVPKGKTELKAGDKLLIMMNNEESLGKMYHNLGVSDQNLNKLP